MPSNVSKATSNFGPTFASLWRPHIAQAFAEDHVAWDWTGRATGYGAGETNRVVEASLIAKDRGVWAAAGLLPTLVEWTKSECLGASVEVVHCLNDGEIIEPGKVLAQLKGSAHAILIMERTMINLASFVCGIATKTSELVNEVQRVASSQKLSRPPRVTGTRKTLPGYRDLSLHGIICGGGYSHRHSLVAGVLIKENNIAACGGIGAALAHARAVAPHTLKLEIEVRNLRELSEALDHRADIVMLDNFDQAQVLSALEVIRHYRKSAPVTVEVSGGVNWDNIHQYVLEGVDIISVGGITHSVKSLDMSLLFDGAL